MKKNKFFTGVLVLLFVLSFSVSQVLLAGDSPQPPAGCPEATGFSYVGIRQLACGGVTLTCTGSGTLQCRFF